MRLVPPLLLLERMLPPREGAGEPPGRRRPEESALESREGSELAAPLSRLGAWLPERLADSAGTQRYHRSGGRETDYCGQHGLPQTANTLDETVDCEPATSGTKVTEITLNLVISLKKCLIFYGFSAFGISL